VSANSGPHVRFPDMGGPPFPLDTVQEKMLEGANDRLAKKPGFGLAVGRSFSTPHVRSHPLRPFREKVYLRT